MSTINLLKMAKLGSLISLSLVMQSALATEQDDLSELRGKAFTKPSYIVPLPDEWQKKPIKYPASFGPVDIAVALNQQLFTHLEPLIREYGKKKDLKIKIVDTTCGSAAGHMFNKEVDIASFCCPPGKIDRLPGIRFDTLGIHPVAFFVHPDNPVDGVNLRQLRQIYQGDIENWSALGGSHKKIDVAGTLHCKKRPGHWKLLLGHEDDFGPNFINIGMDDSVKRPASNPQIISFESVLTAQRFWRDVNVTKSKIKAIKINGYSPENVNHLLAGNYPLYRVFNLTTWEGSAVENSDAQDLVSYLIEKVEKTRKDEFLSAAKLKKAGWKFYDNELIGEPE